MNSELSLQLQYKNTSVVTSFCHDHPEYSLVESQVLFDDLLGWMWLNQQRHKMGKKTYLFGPLLILDEMWHTFILHTRDYVEFSMRYFGEYFHHEVEPVGFEHLVEEDELTDFLDDCFLYLDEAWVERRFSKAFVAAYLIRAMFRLLTRAARITTKRDSCYTSHFTNPKYRLTQVILFVFVPTAERSYI